MLERIIVKNFFEFSNELGKIKVFSYKIISEDGREFRIFGDEKQKFKIGQELFVDSWECLVGHSSFHNQYSKKDFGKKLCKEILKLENDKKILDDRITNLGSLWREIK